MPKGRQRRTRTTGTVVRNPSGTWRARVHTADGSRVSLGSFRTRTEAERVLATAVGEQSKGTLVSPKSGRLAFETYVADWLLHRPGLRPSLTPSPTSGQIGWVWTSSFNWDATPRLVDKTTVILHEFGHSNGLGHPFDCVTTPSAAENASAMTPDVYGPVKRTTTSDDDAGMVSLYGK